LIGGGGWTVAEPLRAHCSDAQSGHRHRAALEESDYCIDGHTRFAKPQTLGEYGNVSFAGPVTAEVRLYGNNGPLSSGVSSPGPTAFYDGGPISLASIGATPTDRKTLIFSEGLDWPGGLLIPASDITWTVQFERLGATDSVGLDIYYPSTVGSTYGDYWMYNGSTWLLETNSEAPLSSFGAYLDATVPEPSTLLLSVLGGLGILTLACRLRRKD